MIDEYLVTGPGIRTWIHFDEDSYCVIAEHWSMKAFETLDFEWFREQCQLREWEFELQGG